MRHIWTHRYDFFCTFLIQSLAIKSGYRCFSDEDMGESSMSGLQVCGEFIIPAKQQIRGLTTALLLINSHHFSHLFKTIWSFPRMGVSLNHLLPLDFLWINAKPTILGTIYGHPPFLWPVVALSSPRAISEVAAVQLGGVASGIVQWFSPLIGHKLTCQFW